MVVGPSNKSLELQAVIGFGGKVNNGLLITNDGETLIYALGSTIVLRSVMSLKEQEFLQGHENNVSCLALSPSGQYLASGQITHSGFAADIIVWDIESRKIMHRMSLHKVKVQALSFSCDDMYLASLGGQDDNNLVVWDITTGKAVCGSPTSRESTLTVKFCSMLNNKLITSGHQNQQVWDLDYANRKLKHSNCNMGQIKRTCGTIVIDEHDEYAYFGSASGDLLQVALKSNLFKTMGPKSKISMGITCSALCPNGNVLIGGGNGTVAIIEKGSMRTVCSTELQGGLNSVAVVQASFDDSTEAFSIFCGTNNSNIYLLNFNPEKCTLEAELWQTCHYSRINDVAFPFEYSGIFATSSMEDIRLWHASEYRELIRIRVPNLECSCIVFTKDGKTLVSGWSDGKIRAFGPQTGKLLYVINDAHQQGVTAIAATSDCERIVSGGKEGQVRVWRIEQNSQSMIASMKEHKGPINSIQIRQNDKEFVSASSDGSCITWDLSRFVRNNSLFASTFFKAILYHPDESQLLTTGTDRKLTYWDAYDGQAIRIIEGSETSEMNALAISNDGELFAAGGGDKIVKVFGYDEGCCQYWGKGHSGAITRLKISPDQDTIVSVGTEGGIFIWSFPQSR